MEAPELFRKYQQIDSESPELQKVSHLTHCRGDLLNGMADRSGRACTRPALSTTTRSASASSKSSY
jgi:hypothetical protein